MFCRKCGNKVADDTNFCPKCGTDLTVSKAVLQTPFEPVERATATPEAQAVPQPQATLGSPELQEAHDLLTKSAARCPKIKEITLPKKGLLGSAPMFFTIKGFFYSYLYGLNAKTGKATISPSLAWSFIAILFPLGMVDALFLQFFFDNNRYTGLTICFLVGCIAWFPLSYFAYIEGREIISHINETLGCERRLPSKALLVVVFILNFIGIGLGIVALI